jgi:2-phospho-L-lactate guanylyltransferase
LYADLPVGLMPKYLHLQSISMPRRARPLSTADLNLLADLNLRLEHRAEKRERIGATIMRQIWALVPVKNFALAKSRLASTLSADNRRSLAIAMALDVATALKQSKAIAQVVLVSDIPELDRLLGVDGVRHFDTHRTQGLNEDLTAAADWAGCRGATHVFIVHADLPLLTAAAVDRFIASERDTPAAGLRVAACRKGSGANALLAPAPLPLPLVFGNNSLVSFCRIAAETGVSIEVIHDLPLATDIDELDDLRALIPACDRGAVVGRATATLLAQGTLPAHPRMETTL